ncbi:sigma-70 family RNA polymerase sigma factor [Halomonas sp. 328]|uniref:sigma-70 family RNA polymerase sigma factor n=1 Tax=Halomonas sp. 328 TaxID=2776704 RepID=UPI00227D9562|nr:sigma-70 family RNA polymerase sigma factor [Halomonas sp. 328]
MSLASSCVVTAQGGSTGRHEAQREGAMTLHSASSPRQRRQWFQARLEAVMDRLYGRALRLTRHPDDAEDIVAETVTRAWARLDELRDPERFEGWLFHILTTTFISDWRRRRCRPQADLSLDEAQETFCLYERLHQPFLLWWGSAEERFFNGLLKEELERALDDLAEEFRLVMVLVEVEGHTYAETAGLLGIPVGTVRSRLSRARGQLQHRLWLQARERGLGGPGAAEEEAP